MYRIKYNYSRLVNIQSQPLRDHLKYVGTDLVVLELGHDPHDLDDVPGVVLLPHIHRLLLYNLQQEN